MKRYRIRSTHFSARGTKAPAALIGCGLLALLSLGAPVWGAQDKPELPKPVRVPPAAMPALPTAVIDDTLAIGGENIDAKKVRSRMTIAVQVNGTGPYRFVVDSGADSSVIGTRIARTLQMPAGTSVTLNGMTGSSIVPRVLVDELGLGPTSVADLELPVLKEGDLGGDGMLGIDALADQRLMMDFEKRTINVEDANKRPVRWDGEIVVTARRRRGQLILTQAKANGRQIEAVIDTGSEITIGNMALREQIVRRRSAKLEKIEVTGVTGVTVDLEIARVAEIRLGSVILRNVPIAFANVPPFEVFGMTQEPALLLGTDLMENFRRISLDFRARKVRFQLRKCESSGIMINTSSGTSMSRLGVERGATETCKR
jgi:predicted aspartyl protease